MRVLFNCKSPRVNLRLSSIKPLSYLLPSFLPFCVPTGPVFLLVSSRSPHCYTVVSFLPSVLLILMVVLTIPSQLRALVLPLSLSFLSTRPSVLCLKFSTCNYSSLLLYLPLPLCRPSSNELHKLYLNK